MIETPAQILSHAASLDAASGFVAWRKKIRKPLTERAAALILDTLRQIKDAGGDPDKALDLAQEHGWQTIKSDWYWRQVNGAGNSNTRGDADTDATARRIAFAAATPRTPQPDWN